MAYTQIPAPDHVVPRAPVVASYISNMLTYLKARFPEENESRLLDWVKEDVQKQILHPTCKAIVYPRLGDCDLVTMDLAKYIKEHRSSVITPCGTMFKCDPDNVPPSVKYNDTCRLDRKKFKKLMFVCFEKGDMFGYALNDGKQGLKKIKNNSIIGAHGFEGSPFYDKESFGAITSLGRNGVILTYALAEQCLANNFYWNDGEKVINYLVNLSKYAPTSETIQRLVDKYNLYIPDADKTAKVILNSSKYYLNPKKRAETFDVAKQLLEQMTDAQRAYIFYRRNLINMFVYNSELFKSYIDRIRSMDRYLESRSDYTALLEETAPESVFSVDEDVVMMLSIIYNHILDYRAVNKELVKNHPEVAKRVALIGKYVTEVLDEMDELYSPFMYHGELLSQVPDNKYMLRKAVAVSDTDSLLFTMKTPVGWYTDGDLRIKQPGIDMAAYMVFILSRILNIANRDLAISKGAVRSNVDLIELKSEYLYAVFVKTDMGKHYFAKYLAKEGRVQKNPPIDIKGVELQTSTIPKVSRKFASDVMSMIIDDVVEHGNVYETDLVGKCLEYEKQILEVLRLGMLDFYSNASIKDKDQYKDADRSIYFNYTLWTEVFEPDFGPIHLPGKYPVVPFKDKIMRSKPYLNWMEDNHPEIHRRYMRFLDTIPATKNITRLPLPGTLNKVPEVLLPAVNIRSLIFKNLKPAQLALRQLGISFGKPKQMPLFLDQYTTVTDESLALDIRQ